ncbi:MAG: esterase-like activity of phytase family protein [Candidatus Entotheonellia bacterium]
MEEYSSSIVKVDRHGKVSKRFVPVGLTPPPATSGYETVGALPAILGKRKLNRGLEGATLSPDQHTLYAVVQSPLLNPDRSTGSPTTTTLVLAASLPTVHVGWSILGSRTT